MQKNKRMHGVNRAIGLICVLVLLISALYVPLSFSVSAAAVNSVPIVDDTPFVFDFENTVTDEAANKTEAETNGIGYFGWGPKIKTYTDAEGKVTNSVLQLQKNASSQAWATSGGYRLHTKLEDGNYGFYKLETNTTYVVSFKLRVLTSAVKLTGSSDTATSAMYLGYNSSYNANASGSGGNYVNGMKDEYKIKVFDSVIESDMFTVYDAEGKGTNYLYGEDWINVRYIIKTPAKFDADPVLAFWGDKYHGFDSEIDDVSVIKVGPESGMVHFIDEYSGTDDISFGKAGTAVTLPDISDKAQNPEHIFEGWYSDAERTQKLSELKFTTDTQTVYSRWKAPVTITFMDKLNGTEKTVTGSAGEKFNYPADPVNPKGDSWFVGWYTDEGYTSEHTSGKFGYASQTLYAYFKGKIPGLTQDFENYTKDKYTVQVDGNGQAYKSNRLNFAATMSKQSEVTYDNSGFAVKYHWNPVPINDKNNEHYYDTSRVTSLDNYFNIGGGLDNDTVYVMTFKYLAEKAGAPVNFCAISGANGNAWGGMVTYAGPQNFTLETDGEWHEVSFQFKTAYIETHRQMYLCILNTENVETIVYFDNIVVEAYAQPYESLAVIHDGINKTPTFIKGEIGKEIELPTLTHPMEAEFLGWFYDEELTLSAENPVFKRGELNVYAGWIARTGFTQDFENYTRDKKNPAKYNKDNGTADDKSDDYTVTYYSNYLDFYTTMQKQSDVVYGGNYAIKFEWNTDPAYNKDVSSATAKNAQNPDSYEHSRYSAYDNLFNIGKDIENNQYYSITFKYKVAKGDQKVQFYVISATAGNSWAGRKTYDAPTKEAIKPGDWQEYSFVFKTQMNKDTDSLYLGVALTEHEDTVIYFDDVKVVSVLNSNEVMMEINTGFEEGTRKYPCVKGKEVELPTITHPEGAEFRGYFTDAERTVPFDTKTLPTENFTLYAKWGPYAMDFETYTYEFDKQKDPSINRVTKPGVGNGDDHAMQFYVNRKVTNTTGFGTTQAFKIAENIEDGAIYKIKFDYRSTSIQTGDAKLTVNSSGSENLWWNDINHSYAHTAVDLPAGGTGGWKSAEFIIKAKVNKIDWRIADDLYLRFTALIYNAGDKIDAYVDNVYVEKIETPYVFFEGQNGGDPTFFTAEPGEKIVYPAKNPTRVGFDFDGWYNEPECLTKFTLETLTEDTFATAYAKWKKSATSVYSFENYTRVPDDGGWDFAGGKVSEEASKTGKKGLLFGNRDENLTWTLFAVEDGGEYFQVENGYSYILTLNYRIKKYTDTSLQMGFLASAYGNYFVGANSNQTNLSPTMVISKSEAESTGGKWATKTFILNAMNIPLVAGEHKCDQLYGFMKAGDGWEIYIDDISITKVPKGKIAIGFNTDGAKGCPEYIVGKVGDSYAHKIPEKLTKEGMYFKGYFIKNPDGTFTEVTRDKMVFGDSADTIFARFLYYSVEENFDTGYYDKAYGKGLGYTIHDFDYEVYDSEKEGNSKDNVTSGRYSLHRKGDSMFKENAVVLTLGNQISEGERYTVSMKIKLGKHFHTDGAVKIVSGRSFNYAWTTTGDYYPVIPISELKEGEWVEVSYTFNSVESFACIQTPGYVELFIDDIKFVLADENTPLSEPKEFVEYVAAERDENGKLVEIDRTAIDVSTIIDANKGKTSFPWLIVVIGAAALVVAAGITVIIVALKKKGKKA